MRVLARIEAALLRQRGYLFPWAPVCMALGIGAYFLLPQEPSMAFYVAVVLAALSGTWVALRHPGAWTPLGAALALAAIGFLLSGYRAHQVAGPVLDWHYYGPVEGRVVGLDRSASDAPRVTLDRVRLLRVAPDETPRRVRMSLHGDASELPVPGQQIMTTGHLSPPQGPVEPGGFDFRRHAWFKSIGAVGYTRVPVLTVAPPDLDHPGMRIFALRMAVSTHIRQVLPGDVGGFAAAVTTGDRSGVSLATLDALRASNLAHLLAISGLHMGLLTGFVFAGLRFALCLIPPLALRWLVKKLAAIGALLAAAAYLALSGGNVATERAFIMVSVMLCAVLVDRRAISLRAVAMAALIVLALRPESLLSPGFQMSFAATTTLVAVFGAIRGWEVSVLPKWLKPTAGVVISSAVAGFATAPVAAAHFNAIAHYGLPANLLSVPLMGLLVIPAAVLALCLSPFGLGWIGLKLMGLGLTWILGVAHYVAGLEGARGFVVSPGPLVLPLLTLGALFVILWQGRLRWVGVLPVFCAFGIWAGAERPQVLIADSGKLVGVMTDTGRALSRAKGSGFVAKVWLENDGDGKDQATAATRWTAGEGQVPKMRLESWQIVHVAGKRAARTVTGCAADQIIVTAVPLDLPGGCRVVDPALLRQTGSLSISETGKIAASKQGQRRLWHGPRAKDKRRRDQ
ncbi:ComEC family competence protein [Ruegeria sp. 2012CJ41-6]|uniref:ComEC family competence protein n=1 Tax=Ruegeria spongiae TaxID=2942209 RepID=A0ABT0PXD8_9RHOB|nr:ComEC/Rec2 family competence protein [Ruegeria spongiae]MCL6282187.1 ComEC family competence protein [Ruegeria spongiae]